MDALILFSHGSLLCGAGEAIETHAARLQGRETFGWTGIGYLNYSEPRFMDAVARAVGSGATAITVVPYFLAPGYFVTNSLPKLLDEARAAFPEIEFRVAASLGVDDRLADALLDAAECAAEPERWNEPLLRASSRCERRDNCPLFGTSNCPTTANAATPAMAEASR